MNNKNKAILVVSFGTSYEETRKKCIESIENKIKDEFEEYEVRRAFTSGMIISKLRKRDNLYIDNVEEALNKLKLEGYKEVYVQSLHLIPGDEYDKVCEGVQKFNSDFEKVIIGRPLLYSSDDYKVAARALETQLPERSIDKAVVLMGHGSEHYANSAYPCLQYVLEDEGINNVHIATVEGYPELGSIINKLHKKNIKEVTLMPYMLVAGDHAQNDMASDEEDSWKSILVREGFKVNIYLHGLGENEKYQDIFVEHLRDIINSFKIIV